MSWAAGRRLLIACIVFAVAFLLIGWFLFSTLYRAPSCTDGLHNQDERGVDCGGSCTYLCNAEFASPVVKFTRFIRFPNGRTDVIAHIENPNGNVAAKGVAFTLQLYGRDHAVITEKSGVLDLPPRSAGVTAVYVPGFFSGSEEVAQAFLSFDEATIHWYKTEDTRLLPEIGDSILTGEDTAPRVRAEITNPHTKALRNLTLIVTIFDEQGNALAASQTIIAELLPNASTDAVFTWNAPFLGTASVVDVHAVVPLP